MNKTDLIAVASEQTGLSKKDTERVVNAALDAITAELSKGERVQLSGRSAPAGIPGPTRRSRSPLPLLPLSRPPRL